MNGLLSMIGMQTELEYQMGDDFPFGSPRIRFNVPKGNIPSDKQKHAIWLAIKAIDYCVRLKKGYKQIVI